MHPSGAGGMPFRDDGRRGVEFDADSNGLVVRAMARAGDYLWIPNVNESTLSKWDASTATEVGRYRVGLPAGECVNRCCWENGCNMPSRVVVDGFGDGYVANRGFAMQGTVTKIAADRRDCVDRNMNGMIDTSSGPMDVRPYGEDECVLWNAAVGPSNAVLRSLAIDRGDENFPQGYPWIGACAGDPNAGLWQLNPRTGETIRHVDFTRCAYGAVVTSDGTLWEHTPSVGITPVNTTSGMVGELVPVPSGMRGGCASTYGITTDASSRIWLAGRNCRDVVAYDPMLRQWSRVELSTHIPGGGGAGLGITVDPSNHVWVPISLSDDWSGTARLGTFDAAVFMPGATIASAAAQHFDPPAAPTNPTALGADRGGKIWMTSAAPGAPLLRFDPMTMRWDSYAGPNRVYTYTDFTGAVRRLVIGTGTYTENYMACDNPQYAELRWDALTPGATTLSFSLQLADSVMGLATAMPIALGVAPRDSSPINVGDKLRAAGVMMPGRFARLVVTFTPTNMPVSSPVLRGLSLSWRCPGGAG